jgi:lipopolysaccharide/colanic/teichoic acid biosynthesis glycosyltransferase
VIAPAALLLVSPVVLVCLLAIRVDSKGPVFFRQIRVGEGGRLFLLYKLRTMLVDTDESSHAAYVKSMIEGTASRKGTLFKLVDDPRVTRVGRVLRRLSLDEVPQLWNVIKGDMTLVGPRPPLPREVDLYDDRSWERLYVKPGLTGLWQVSGRSERSFHEMIDLDIAYWRSWSVGLEFRILVKTLPALVTARGAA